MPSGEPAPPGGRRNRTLESLGGSSRLELGLGGVIRVLRRRGIVLILVFAVAFVAIYAMSSQLQKRYSSIAWVKITDPNQSLFDKNGATVDLTKEQRAVVLTLQSPKLDTSLRHQLGKQYRDLKQVSATGLEASPLIEIGTQATSPDAAQRAGDAVSRYVVEDSRSSTQADFAAQAKTLNDNLNTPGTGLVARLNAIAENIAAKPDNDPALPALQAQQASLESSITATQSAADQAKTSSLTATGGLRVYEAASRPTGPDFPKPLSWAILGSLAVLVLAMALIYGREELVGRFQSGDASESRRAGARVLGVLPNATGVYPRGVVTGATTTVEEVGLQLVHLLGRDKPNVVLLCGVDGPAPEETTRRIAQAIAESGSRVVFAACRGVAAAPEGDELEAPVPRARLSVVQEQQTGGRLRLLDDGIPVADLTVARARTVLRRLTEQCEYVVIAALSPTVEPATLVLAELADATVMIAQHGETKLRDTERAGARLRRVGGAVLGVIADSAKPRTARTPYVPRASGVSAG